MKTVVSCRNTYAYYLKPNMKKRYAQAYIFNKPVEQLKSVVRSYIYPATYSYVDAGGKRQYTRKKDFIDSLNSCENNHEIYWLCYNTVKCAESAAASI